MFKTLLTDRETIEHKYHEPGKEYNPINRFGSNYHGYEYDESTGLDDAQIDQGLAALSESLEGTPHPVHKAKLFEYVLDNTRIDVNEHDYFIGIYTWSRPLFKYTVNKWYKEVEDQFPEATETIALYGRAGVGFGGLDFEHTVPDWDAILSLGFSGLLQRARATFSALKDSGELTEDQEHFFESVEIAYSAILRLFDRLYRYAVTKDFEKATKIAECLKHLRDGAPTNSYEAMQIIYIYFMLSESIDHCQVRSLGYGLDATLAPFFRKDIEAGVYSEDELRELLGYFLLQYSAIGNYWGQPFYLGGTNADGSTKVNEISYLILDVYDKLGLYNPKIQIKVNRSTPKEFICKAAEMIRHGTSSIVFCNDDGIIKCLISRGSTYEKAVDGVISGCYEYYEKGTEIASSVIYFNTLKPISYVFDNGFDTVCGSQVGLKTGELCELDNFDKFYDAYLKQLAYLLESHLSAFNALEMGVHSVNPLLMFSATSEGCISKMADALHGGLRPISMCLLNGLASTADALMSVRELVYERKAVTLSELKTALDADWNGYEELRHQAIKISHKYGNNDAMADSCASALVKFVSDMLIDRKNLIGGPTLLELHSARAFLIHGEQTKATPDGRRFGDETSKNASAAPGADRKGITSLINSAIKTDPSLCNLGFCLDAMLHPSAVQGEDGLEALYAIITTYMNLGGASIHFNVFNPEMLKDAREHPEKYKNLQVRVCGWNVLWNNMDKKEQDAYILRAENIQ